MKTSKTENYIVYCHICPEGKMYIGQSCRSLKDRAGSNGSAYSNCTRFYKAIKKFGWDNIQHITIFEGLSREMASIIEIELIKKYDTTNPDNGYNILPGGALNLKIPQNIYQYDLNGNFIKEYACVESAGKETCVSNGQIYQSLCGNQQTAGGYIWRYDYLEKIDCNIKPSNVGRPVGQYSKDGIRLSVFDCIKTASENTGIPVYTISRAVNRPNSLGANYMWSYDCQNELIEPYHETSHKIKHKNQMRYKKVYQFSLDGVLLTTYNSGKEAAEKIKKLLNLKSKSILCNICAACRGEQKTAYGYIWSYSDNILISKSVTAKHPVHQINKDGVIIKTFNSISEAEEMTNISHSNIIACCKGRRPFAGGYQWQYAG